MCGLVGVAGNLVLKDEELIKRLLCHDYWRGKDSTGLAAVRKTDEIKIAKMASHPIDLFDAGRFKTALSAYSSKAFIGHNRAATKGSVTAYNAHPFEFGDIVGAHNGTLHYSSHTALEDKLGEKFSVDSQALIAAIDAFGIKETIEMIEGAWAITWFDATDNTLNFIRNKERPLWYSYSEKYDKIYWASEHWMIENACGMMGFDLAVLEEDGKRYKFFSTEADTHYKWDLAKLSAGSAERPKPKARLIKGKEAPVKHNRDSAYDPFNRDGKGTNQTSSNTGTGTTTTSLGPTPLKRKNEPVTDPRHVNLLGDVRDPFAGIISRADFEDIAKYGCSHCNAAIDWEDVGITIFERDQIILCPECSQPDEKKQNRIYVKDLKPYIC